MTKPYTIFRARDEYEIYGVVSVPDADNHETYIYENEEDADRHISSAVFSTQPIIVLPYSGEFNVQS